MTSADVRRRGSPRAYETAEVIGLAKGLTITADTDLREMDVGSWTGLTYAQIEDRHPGMESHDGESREAFDARAIGALTRIASAHDDVQLLVVTHGGVVRALQRHMLGEPRPVLGNCETAEFRYERGSFVSSL